VPALGRPADFFQKVAPEVVVQEHAGDVGHARAAHLVGEEVPCRKGPAGLHQWVLGQQRREAQPEGRHAHPAVARPRIGARQRIAGLPEIVALFDRGEVVEAVLGAQVAARSILQQRPLGEELQHMRRDGRVVVSVEVAQEPAQRHATGTRVVEKLVHIRVEHPPIAGEALDEVLPHGLVVSFERKLGREHGHVFVGARPSDGLVLGAVVQEGDVMRPQRAVMLDEGLHECRAVTHEADHGHLFLPAGHARRPRHVLDRTGEPAPAQRHGHAALRLVPQPLGFLPERPGRPVEPAPGAAQERRTPGDGFQAAQHDTTVPFDKGRGNAAA
jgi:hypothetical protein